MDYEKNNPVFSILEQLFGDVLAKEIAENLMLPAMFPPHMFPALFPPHKGFHRDTKAMDSTTPTDVIEYPDAYVFMVDMPGLKSGDIKVQVEEEKKDNILVISGERKRKEEKEVIPDVYVMKKFMRKFVLADNANTNSISAVSEDGVLTVTVKKLSFSPLPKMPKIIQVKKIAS